MQHATFTTPQPVQPYADWAGIGQAACARISADIAQEEMGRVVANAFGIGWVNELVRESSRATFYSARAEYERAMAIIATPKV